MASASLPLALTTALGFSLLHFQPFSDGTTWLDFWDFIVSTNILPLGYAWFSPCSAVSRFGWGWDGFIREANAGKGLKVQDMAETAVQIRRSHSSSQSSIYTA